MEFGVWGRGLGFGVGVWGLGFRVWGVGVQVKDSVLGIIVYGLWFEV